MRSFRSGVRPVTGYRYTHLSPEHRVKLTAILAEHGYQRGTQMLGISICSAEKLVGLGYGSLPLVERVTKTLRGIS